MESSWKRQYLRVNTKSILVSLVDTNHDQEITGFLRDISEGGMKIQKLSAKRQLELGVYECSFLLDDLGRITTRVEVLGLGDTNEKFSEHLLRMRFVLPDFERSQKIKAFVERNK